ncbi:MAG: hypothetical protein ACXWL5_04520 [Candidatus Chromulinivorax sp.]
MIHFILWAFFLDTIIFASDQPYTLLQDFPIKKVSTRNCLVQAIKNNQELTQKDKDNLACYQSSISYQLTELTQKQEDPTIVIATLKIHVRNNEQFDCCGRFFKQLNHYDQQLHPKTSWCCCTEKPTDQEIVRGHLILSIQQHLNRLKN